MSGSELKRAKNSDARGDPVYDVRRMSHMTTGAPQHPARPGAVVARAR
jgi:hypothetical protein